MTVWLKNKQRKGRSLFLTTLPLIGSITLSCIAPIDWATAQIVPDNTLPDNSVVPPGCTACTIDGGTVRGSNLFHSFSEFSVPTGGKAFFNNAPEIQNILSRVTGGSVSTIDGLIRANGTANLFLVNPSGIVFGPNASLSVGGSFFASTADSLVFDNGFEFSATNPQAPPLLTVNIPIGLRFRDNPGNIINQSQALGFDPLLGITSVGLQVPFGETLALVGGDVTLEGGNLSAPEGRIELGSVGGNSLVSLSATNTGLALGYQGVQTFQDIQLSGQSRVDASGNSGGNIQVQGQRLMLTDGSQIQANTLGSGTGGTLTVSASESVELIGTSLDEKFNSALGTVAGSGTGNAGSVTIETGKLVIRDGALVAAGTLSEGNGGNLTVRASNSVEVSGTSPIEGQRSTLAAITSSGTGDAGNVSIDTGRLIVRDGGLVSTGTVSSAGNGGELRVSATDSVELTGTSDNGEISQLFAGTVAGTGDAGDVTIETGRLIIQDGASVSTITSLSLGNAGDLTVRASESVELTGTSVDGNFPSALGAVTASGIGDAGDVTIETGRLIVRDGAGVLAGSDFSEGDAGNITVRASESVELDGTSFDGKIRSILSAATFSGTGDAGDVTVETGRLIVRDGASIAVLTTGEGDAGNITVLASESVELDGTSFDGNSSMLSAATFFGTGDAGDVTVETGRLIVRDGASIGVSTTGEGDAGNITVLASELVELTGSSSDGKNTSSLIAGTSIGTGDAGDVTIETERLLIRDGAEVLAGSVLSEGQAGGITVKAQDVEIIGTTPDGQSRSSLKAGTIGGGDAGDVTIETGRLRLKDGAEIDVRSRSVSFDGNAIKISGEEPINVSDLVPLTDPAQLQLFLDFLAARGLVLGNPGSINITASEVLLDNQAALNATSEIGKGGNINLQARDIILRRQSQISAAGSEASITQEGNIGINAELLVLLERSRIITSAFDPVGGSNIKISPLFDDLYIFRSPDSIINAENQLVIEGELEFDPAEAPPIEVADPDEQIAQNPCTRGKGSEFIVTGRGGLPVSPNEPLNSDAVQVGLVEPVPTIGNDRQTQISESNTSPIPNPTLPLSSRRIQNSIVPAQGWVLNEKGEVVLTAYNSISAGPQRPWQHPAACPAP